MCPAQRVADLDKGKERLVDGVCRIGFEFKVRIAMA